VISQLQAAGDESIKLFHARRNCRLTHDLGEARPAEAALRDVSAGA
jgi:hypothetical protein